MNIDKAMVSKDICWLWKYLEEIKKHYGEFEYDFRKGVIELGLDLLKGEGK